MLVSDIWQDLEELTGTCSEETNYAALSLGLEWLANEQLFDPLIDYIDFRVENGHTIALPREVKAPIRLNINNNPAFHRGRLFEFAPNSDGSVDGDEVEWTWANRGRCFVQDERKLPARLKYVPEDAADNGKTLTIKFRDPDGRVVTETLVGHATDAELSTSLVDAIISLQRQETAGVCFLNTEFDDLVGQYYPDETTPEYRVIKLSQTSVAVRMMFRRHTPKRFTSQTDIIYFDSRLAIIHAAKAVRLLQKGDYEEAAKAAVTATGFAKKEQATQDLDGSTSVEVEVISARNSNISTIDSLIVADLYDDAAEIFGPIGRAKIFDRMSVSRDALGNKGNWDALSGVVDLVKATHAEDPTPTGKGHGIFTLPRFVGAVQGVSLRGQPQMPRNSWFEFHLNGRGEQWRSSSGTWDEIGTSCTFEDLALDETTKLVIPRKLMMIAEEEMDEDEEHRIFGIERRAGGEEVEVYRDGVAGWIPPCKIDPQAAADGAPDFVRITGVNKPKTAGFTKLIWLNGSSQGGVLGLYYPDETRPIYRRIKISQATEQRVRIKYRLRTNRISSLYEPLHLHSPLALTTMMQAVKARKDGDSKAADELELAAQRYLVEHEGAELPTNKVRMQMAPGTGTGGFRVIR